MKDRVASLVPLCLVFAGCSFTGTLPAAAQSAQATLPPPVLEVIVEYLKPGQAGTPHQKTEAAFVKAMADAKSPTHYLGMTAVTGVLRAVFFVGYDSFAGLQTDMDATQKNATLASALDSASIADGSLLEGTRTNIYSFRKDLSLNPGADIGHIRYFDVTIYHLRAGHEKDWDTVVKLYSDAYSKIPGSHWDMFEQMYGTTSGGSFVVIMPLKSLAEIDQNMANDKKLPGVVAADQLQKMRDLAGATVESSESQILAVDPKMSYASDAWSTEDPAFWNQK